jgi:magnesium-transporting ATPase (P-type)
VNREPIQQREAHRSGRSKWLRAAVLGSGQGQGVVLRPACITEFGKVAHLTQTDREEVSPLR